MAWSGVCDTMCLILIAYGSHPRYPLVIAANRDEFYDRPTAQAGFWAEAPWVLAGRDLQAGGTWLGMTTDGRFAALTNIRSSRTLNQDGQTSRGALVSAFLMGRPDPSSYLHRVAAEANAYNGFNLVVGSAEHLWFYHWGQRAPRLLRHGIYGLSNDSLDTPWPKVMRAKAQFQQVLVHASFSDEDLLAILQDATEAPDDALPETGVPLALERALSPPFIATPSYGTRLSTLIRMDTEGRVSFREVTYPPPEPPPPVSYTFTVSTTDPKPSA